MGHLVVSRCALYLAAGRRPSASSHERGVQSEDASRPSPRRGRARALDRARGPAAVSETAPGPAEGAAAAARAWGWRCPSSRARASRVPGRGRARLAARPSRRRTTTSRRRWPARRWPRWRARACTACSWRSSARTGSSRSRARSSRACSRAACPRARRLRGRGGEPALLRGGRRLLRLHPPRRRPAGPGRRRRLGQGHARQHPHGLRARVAAGAGGHRLARGGPDERAEPLPVREHAGEQVRHALLRASSTPRRAASPTSTPATCLPTACGRETGVIERLLCGRAGAGPARRGVVRGGGGRPRARATSWPSSRTA